MTKDDLIWEHEEDRYYEHDLTESDEERLYKDDCAERANDMNQENRSVW